jgi:hypothetical protein
MEVIELKKQIIHELDSVSDEKQLESYYNLIAANNHWDNLSKEKQDQLINMVENSDQYNWVSHEEAAVYFTKWKS